MIDWGELEKKLPPPSESGSVPPPLTQDEIIARARGDLIIDKVYAGSLDRQEQIWSMKLERDQIEYRTTRLGQRFGVMISYGSSNGGVPEQEVRNLQSRARHRFLSEGELIGGPLRPAKFKSSLLEPCYGGLTPMGGELVLYTKPLEKVEKVEPFSQKSRPRSHIELVNCGNDRCEALESVLFEHPDGTADIFVGVYMTLDEWAKRGASVVADTIANAFDSHADHFKALGIGTPLLTEIPVTGQGNVKFIMCHGVMKRHSGESQLSEKSDFSPRYSGAQAWLAHLLDEVEGKQGEWENVDTLGNGVLRAARVVTKDGNSQVLGTSISTGLFALPTPLSDPTYREKNVTGDRADKKRAEQELFFNPQENRPLSFEHLFFNVGARFQRMIHESGCTSLERGETWVHAVVNDAIGISSDLLKKFQGQFQDIQDPLLMLVMRGRFDAPVEAIRGSKIHISDYSWIKLTEQKDYIRLWQEQLRRPLDGGTDEAPVSMTGFVSRTHEDLVPLRKIQLETENTGLMFSEIIANADRQAINIINRTGMKVTNVRASNIVPGFSFSPTMNNIIVGRFMLYPIGVIEDIKDGKVKAPDSYNAPHYFDAEREIAPRTFSRNPFTGFYKEVRLGQAQVARHPHLAEDCEAIRILNVLNARGAEGYAYTVDGVTEIHLDISLILGLDDDEWGNQMRYLRHIDQLIENHVAVLYGGGFSKDGYPKCEIADILRGHEWSWSMELGSSLVAEHFSLLPKIWLRSDKTVILRVVDPNFRAEQYLNRKPGLLLNSFGIEEHKFS